MTALDTSVAVPALVSWHEHHEQARLLARGALVPAHALAETYSVLTRLPAPHRIDASTAAALLRGWFPPSAVLVGPASMQRRLVDVLSDAGVEGGATYDGLVGLTAMHHREVLVTRDARAARTYRALGVEFQLHEDA